MRQGLRPQRALEYFQKELAILDDLLPDGHPKEWLRHYSECSVALALALTGAQTLRDGKTAEAERMGREAIAMYEKAANWIFAQPPIAMSGKGGPELAAAITEEVFVIYAVMQQIEPDEGHDRAASAWSERLAARQKQGE